MIGLLATLVAGQLIPVTRVPEVAHRGSRSTTMVITRFIDWWCSESYIAQKYYTNGNNASNSVLKIV